MIIAFVLLVATVPVLLGLASPWGYRTVLAAGIATVLIVFGLCATGWGDLGEGREMADAVRMSVLVSVAAGLLVAASTTLGAFVRHVATDWHPAGRTLAWMLAIAATATVHLYGGFILAVVYAANVTCGIDAYECPI